jgi:uncharacterized protein (DUF3820 family)
MARRRRHYGDIVALSGIKDSVRAFKGSVKGTDAVIGGVVALGGIAALNWLKNWKKADGTAMIPFLSTNATVMSYMPALAGVVGGVGGAFAAKKLKKGHMANGILVGSVGAGVAMQLLNILKVKYPAYFADIVDLRLAGLLVNDPMPRGGYAGFLVDDPAPRFAAYADAPNSNLGELAALSMEVDDDDMKAIGIG